MTINDVIIKLLIEKPYYGYMATLVAFKESDVVSTMKMATIPSLIVFYNPNWYDNLTDKHKLGAIVHELNHLLLLHQHRVSKRELGIWSIATDIAINQLIEKELLADTAVTLEKINDRFKIKLEVNKNAEYYYDELMMLEEFVSFIGIEDEILVIFDGENRLEATKLSEEKASKVELDNLKSNLHGSSYDSSMEGDIPSGLLEEVDDLYKELKVNWRRVLKRFLTGRGRMQIRKSYKRKSRRYDYLPGTKRTTGVKALLALDESGSISDAQVMEFYKELRDINRITGAEIYVTRFDTACSKPVPLERFLDSNKREKRGGTDYRQIFQLADSMKMSQVIIFTDGDGIYPEAVNQTTLWVMTSDFEEELPFGVKVNFTG